MKKLFIYLLFIFVILLTGCSNNELKFNVKSITINENETFQLVPEKHIGEINYNIEDTSVATVNYHGLVRGISAGETTLTANYQDISITIKITVSKIVNENPKEEVSDLTVYFIDIGQADAIFLQLPNGENMMIDAGYSYGDEQNDLLKITSLLDSLNVTVIDHFLITHNHSDHYGLVPDILSKYEVKNVYGSGSLRDNTQYLDVMKSIQNAGLDYLVVEVGDFLVNDNYLTIQVVATQQLEDDSDPNISSVMVKLVYKNTSFMFTGDGGNKNTKDAEYIALKSGINLESDVLKVGHHGSRYSSGNQFLQAVKPKYAIMTTQPNSQDNLPTIDAIGRIQAVGATIYQTKEYGTITVTSDGENINISTEK